MRRHFLPLLMFTAIVVYLGIGLTRDPNVLPSPLIGKAVPAFALASLHEPATSISHTSFAGDVVLLNVWATWCMACRQEHAALLDIGREIPIYGIDYKDERDDALRWLSQLGNPYRAVGFDQSGRVGMDLGVYGAPETFVIDRAGVVIYKHVGPLSMDVWRSELLPVVSAARAAAPLR